MKLVSHNETMQSLGKNDDSRKLCNTHKLNHDMRMKRGETTQLEKTRPNFVSITGLIIKDCLAANRGFFHSQASMLLNALLIVNTWYLFYLLRRPHTYFHVCLFDGTASIFSYLLYRDRESNSRQFSCTTLICRLSYRGHSNNTWCLKWLHHYFFCPH